MLLFSEAFAYAPAWMDKKTGLSMTVRLDLRLMKLRLVGCSFLILEYHQYCNWKTTSLRTEADIATLLIRQHQKQLRLTHMTNSRKLCS